MADGTRGPLFRYGPAVLAVLIAAFLLQARHRATGDFGDKAFLAEAERQGFRSELEQRLKAVPGAAARSALVQGLARRGIARLPSDLLVQRTTLLLALDTKGPDSLCAGHFMGTLKSKDYLRYLAPLDPAQRAEWVRISATAVKEELRSKEPVPPPSQGDVGNLFQHLIYRTNSPDDKHLQAVLPVLRMATIQDQCWASRTIAHTVLAMPADDQARTLVLMARIEAGL
jgi:hypothetical protein